MLCYVMHTDLIYVCKRPTGPLLLNNKLKLLPSDIYCWSLSL